ncbi:hypothetical protein [Cryptosporangium sp. NPDC048952]|uniref:hypothetical protein n=1 Tax=Cryptosporangium sp. NPDC048952 TaxID=3363961 RepID=UPI00370F8FC2
MASAAHDRRHARPALDVVFLEQVKLFVEINLADPDLTPAAIAAAHHVSERYLYKLARRRASGWSSGSSRVGWSTSGTSWPIRRRGTGRSRPSRTGGGS